MSFGPFILRDSYVQDGVFILELADDDGNVKYRPGRFIHYSQHDRLYIKAQKLKGKLVTTETVNPTKNSPQKWWIDINEYRAGNASYSQTGNEQMQNYTEEQRECIKKFLSVNNLKISAFAGTGKTTTLLGIANSVPLKKGLYLAFNKEIADEAKKKFPQNVECRTTHSLAYEFASRHYKSDKLTGSLNPLMIAEILKLDPISLGEHQNYSPRQVGKWIVDTVGAFCRSDSPKINKEHVTCGRLSQASLEKMEEYTDLLVDKATEIWDKARDPNSTVVLGHDGYLKLWSISRPRFDKDFIMLDEAQDTNAAVIFALSKQIVKTVYVGDRYQQIYGFRGAFNAMDKLNVDFEAALTTSFRFGSSIADVANSIIQRFGEERRILGNPEVTSEVNKYQASTFIYRTNMGVLGGLAKQLKNNKKPYLVGGSKELTALLDDIELLLSGKQALTNSDFFGFNDWTDLVSFSKEEEGGSYRTVVQLVDSYGVQTIRKMIGGVVGSAKESDVILTTAHKCKGKEWDFVEVGDDFATENRISHLANSKYTFEDSHVEEITLLYVALTRAKLSLNIPDKILKTLNLERFCLGSKQLLVHKHQSKINDTVQIKQEMKNVTSQSSRLDYEHEPGDSTNLADANQLLSLMNKFKK